MTVLFFKIPRLKSALPVDFFQNPPARIHRQAQNPPDFRKNPLMCLLSKIHPPVLLWPKIEYVTYKSLQPPLLTMYLFGPPPPALFADILYGWSLSYLRSGASPSGDAERVDVPRGSVLRRGRWNHELNLPRAAAGERPQFIRLELFCTVEGIFGT